MNIYRRFFTVALLMALAVSVSAATVIQSGTVIPVTMDKSLSSATTRAGSTFYAHHNGVNGAGFPENTQFVGTVQSVTRASGNTAGQIDVGFVSAVLPGGTRVPIDGQLISLDDKSVQIDENTGRLVGTSSASKNRTKFIAIGAGAGLIIGQIAGKHAAIGAILGAAAGYLYNQKQAKPATGRNVSVPAGTRFGILLGQDVTIPGYRYAATPASLGAGPDSGSGWRVTFAGQQPVLVGNELMVPFRSVMDQIEMPFDYNSATRQISISNYESQTTHTVGTRVINTDGQITRMDVASRFIRGAIYVPASFIETLTGRSVYWNHKSGVLRIE
jgi:hypothetical protein